LSRCPLRDLASANYEELRQSITQEAQTLVDRMLAAVRQAGFTVDAVVRQGDPRREIVEEAKAWKPDLIVVGSHGRTGISRWLLGSVAEYVVRHAPCSVEVAREPRRDELE
jgi:nucleotide-binding universal stress UspA family protein